MTVEARATFLLTAVVIALAMLTSSADSAGWGFAPGSRYERLDTTVERMPATQRTVTLPHRELLPNTAMWYRRELNLPSHAALEVDADDGAQVFIDGKRARRKGGRFLAPGRGHRRATIVIRVLNNAATGGLSAVRVVDASALAAIQDVPTPRRNHRILPVGSTAFRREMPSPGDECRFTAWADAQNGWSVFARLVDRMRGEVSHFSAGIGDLVADGSDANAWNAFLRTIAPLAAATRVVPIAGNHEYDGYYDDLRARFYQHLFRKGTDPTWFAWSCGDARFAAIDLNREFPIGISAESEQHRWLHREVRSKAWRDAAWRVLLVHQPPYSRSWPGYDGDEATRTVAARLAREHGLDVVLSGHTHAFERLARRVGDRDLTIMITGGAGGGLEEPFAGVPDPDVVHVRHHYVRAAVSLSSFQMEAVDLSGEVFDRLELRR